jgi:hypothetical protein
LTVRQDRSPIEALAKGELLFCYAGGYVERDIGYPSFGELSKKSATLSGPAAAIPEPVPYACGNRRAQDREAGASETKEAFLSCLDTADISLAVLLRRSS